MDEYRFYVPGLPRELGGGAAGVEVELPEDQGHHARGVLRLEAGERVVVFDGRGAWAAGEISRASKRGVGVRLTGPVTVDARPVPTLTVATAVPKGERAEWLIEQASQLNVGAIQFLDCERGVVKPREGGQKMEKWRRLAVESAKQCGRTHVLEVLEPVALGEVPAWRGAGAEGVRVLWLEPGEGGVSVAEAMGGAREVVALIGPEGGWSAGERGYLEELARGGVVRRVGLTATVLRIETACAAVAALVMSRRVPEKVE